MKKAITVLLVWLLAMTALGAGCGWLAYTMSGRSPGEIIRYGEQRLVGHPRLEREVRPVLYAMLRWLGEPTRAETWTTFRIPPLAPNPLRGATPGAARAPAGGRVLQVGATRAITTISRAAQLARDGDVVEIDAGDYRADVAVWDRADITLRGMGEQVRLIANGASAEGKAIWVIRRGRVTIENIHFIGARVLDMNGAGIRHENGHLTVRNCVFRDNQAGVLSAPSPTAELEIHDSEFGYNGVGNGLTHHLYVSTIKSLTVTGSHFHHANGGHLIKSRAANSLIAYNRLDDGPGGRASYELEFPNGGNARVIGNIIRQARTTTNSAMVSFGAEGYPRAGNRLRLSHNTIINDLRAGGIRVRVLAGADAFSSVNNLLVGPGRFDTGPLRASAGDVQGILPDLAAPDRGDYRIAAEPRRFAATGTVEPDLLPEREFAPPAGSRRLAGKPALVGAMQSRAPGQ